MLEGGAVASFGENQHRLQLEVEPVVGSWPPSRNVCGQRKGDLGSAPSAYPYCATLMSKNPIFLRKFNLRLSIVLSILS